MWHSYLTSARRATLARTFQLWLLSNLGGTLWLLLYFTTDDLDDYPVALMGGLLAAMISLGILPLVLPFFALMTRFFAGWARCYLAVVGVLLFFLLANELLLLLLPVQAVGSLLVLTLPYLASALLAVAWLYGPARRMAPLAQHPTPCRVVA